MVKNLKFNNGKFKIMSLGDLNESLFVESRIDRKRTEDMHNLVKMGLLAFNPDLVVLMGDTCCYKDDSPDFSNYKLALKRILKPLTDSNIPFCIVLGNHEHLGQEYLIIKAYEEFDNFVGINDQSAPEGKFNCNILVKNTDGNEDILNLWFLDSNSTSENTDLSYYDWVHPELIEWYEKKALEIKKGHNNRIIPSIVFQHIPVIEEYSLLRKASVLETPKAVNGYDKFSENKYVLSDNAVGTLGQGPETPSFNGGQFASWKKTGDVIAAFFGHDHLNDFTGYVDGIMLGQNATSGFCSNVGSSHIAIRITTLNENNIKDISSKIYHFNELGLVSTSKGPLDELNNAFISADKKNIAFAAAGILGAAGATKIISKSIKKGLMKK